ncbi:MAG: helix-turn-helix domain-containing protein [Dysosmobacter welbionis]
MREQQTLGRRIQEARKAAGLSQESLGERLGVSRQAVSKWEADAAVPELENLIAMSRIFGVTIGALLGVEPEAAEDRSEKDAPEAPGEGVEGTAPAGELTDRELAAVEAIAKKYLDAAQVVQNPRWSRKKNRRKRRDLRRGFDGGAGFGQRPFRSGSRLIKSSLRCTVSRAASAARLGHLPGRSGIS